jgi:methylmalonyl-CoA/ethylmalonyl-CoA epimerase
MKAALTKVGDVSFELIEPLEGVSAYTDFLEAHGEGIHHVAINARSETAVRSFAAADILMSGFIGDTIQFVYLDAQPTLKMILETGYGDESDLLPDYFIR